MTNLISLPIMASAGLSFDSISLGQNGIFAGRFGTGQEMPRINATGADYAIDVTGWHHGKMAVATTGAAISGLRVNFAVMSEFEVVASSNEATFDQTPANAVVIDRHQWPADPNTQEPGSFSATTACNFRVIAEGLDGVGILNNFGNNCRIMGTSEGNAGGGYSAAPAATRNYVSLFCEQNGSYDIDLNGDATLVYDSYAGSPEGIRVAGGRNIISNTIANKLHIVPETRYTVLRDVGVIAVPDAGGGIMDEGVDTVFDRVFVEHATGSCALPPKRPRPKIKQVGQVPISAVDFTVIGGATRVDLTSLDHGLDYGDPVEIQGLGSSVSSCQALPLNENQFRLITADGQSYVDGSAVSYSSGAYFVYAGAAFANGWTALEPEGRGAVGFQIDAYGWVNLCGATTGGTAGADAFFLPPPFRPAHQILLPAVDLVTGGHTYVTVTAAGQVQPIGGNAVELSSVAFRAG